ncbi:MAG: WhiB family redox-sensing transcriptional regulator [Candidatus Saccharimonadales bacterium]|jgi:WhiB family redox-sensing transcriptional regulator
MSQMSNTRTLEITNSEFYQSTAELPMPGRGSPILVGETKVSKDVEPWQAQGACLGMPPEMFMPERGDKATEKAAKAVCRTCVVKDDCLESAINPGTIERIGVRGGFTEFERRKIIKERNKAS